MAESDSGSLPAEAFYTVQDPEQARLLTHPESFKYFEPFIARERTVSQAAEEVGCKLDTMLYRVKTFLKAGLLKISRLEKRAGRPIKHYRSNAGGYFIPFAVTPYADLAERLKESFREDHERLARNLAKRLSQRGHEGQKIFRAEDGEVWTQSASDAGASVNFSDLESLRRYVQEAPAPTEQLISYVWLTDQEAKEALLELYELYLRYRKKSSQGKAARGRYLLEFALVPLES
jgi:hypothetical protein